MSSIMTRRMTVDEFERLDESLGDERVELIDGRVIGRGDMKPAHVLATGLVKQGVVQTYTPGQEVPVVIDGAEAGRIAVSAILG